MALSFLERKDMLIKKEYKTRNAVNYTLIDNVDKIDFGTIDGVDFVNVYKNGRKKDDDFETINIQGLTLYLMNSDGKTLNIFRER